MVESVTYNVAGRMGKVEFREYPQITLATVREHDDNAAFSLLFGYITGYNRVRERVSMTVPVISTRKSSEKIEMTAPVISDGRDFSFVLPSEYDSGTAPEPLDRRVSIADVPERILAVVRFRGRATKDRVDGEVMKLTESLRQKGIRTRGEALLLRYNPPFTPPFLRRNEVAIEVVRSSYRVGTR